VPIGGYTLMIGLYALLTILMRQKYDAGMQLPLAIAGFAAGAVIDVLYARMRASFASPGALQAFGALVPTLTTAASMLAIAVVQGTWWTIHLWTGAVVAAAATGWLLTFVASSAPAPDATK
jgi:hypothetical protein